MNTAPSIVNVSTARTAGWSARFGMKPSLIDDSALKALLEVAGKKGVQSFAAGFPDPKLLPVDLIASCAAQVLSTVGPSALQYGVAEGTAELKQALCRLAMRDNRPCNPENIVITSGSQQAIDLLAHVFINPGDSIIVTRPCYLGALGIFTGLNPNFLEVSCDEHGPVLSELEAALAKHPKFFYLVSAFQNPTGMSVSRKRAEKIVRLCARYDVPILEDGAYRDLYYGAKVTSLRQIEGEMLADANLSYEENAKVIFMGTLSKVMAPGLRIGWIEAPRQVLTAVTCLKQTTDVHTNIMSQFIAAEFLRTYADEHWRTLRKVYGERRDAMVEAVNKYIGPYAISCTSPTGGYFVWVTLDPAINTSAFLARSVNEFNIAYVPGAPFYATRPERNSMRLCFTTWSPEEIDAGIAQLGRGIAKHLS
jgi:DNA-binding transcriptional MocR family regulator